MLGVRRTSLVRQMAFRQDSNDSEIAIRHHLAPPNSIPDSPRPQKPSNEHPLSNANNLSVDVPTSNKGLNPNANNKPGAEKK